MAQILKVVQTIAQIRICRAQHACAGIRLHALDGGLRGEAGGDGFLQPMFPALIIGEHPLGFEHIAMTRIYLTRFKQDYAAMNETYRSYFPPDRLPARTCVGVTGLAYDALIEIDLVCRRP